MPASVATSSKSVCLDLAPLTDLKVNTCNYDKMPFKKKLFQKPPPQIGRNNFKTLNNYKKFGL